MCEEYDIYRHKLKLVDKLQALSVAVLDMSGKQNPNYSFCLLVLDYNEQSVQIRYFNSINEAGEQFRELEKWTANDSAIADGSIYFAKDAYDATFGADLLCLVTEWQEFRLPNWQIIKKSLKEPIIIDGRNIYDPVELKKLGFEYRGIGM